MSEAWLKYHEEVNDDDDDDDDKNDDDHCDSSEPVATAATKKTMRQLCREAAHLFCPFEDVGTFVPEALQDQGHRLTRRSACS